MTLRCPALLPKGQHEPWTASGVLLHLGSDFRTDQAQRKVHELGELGALLCWPLCQGAVVPALPPRSVGRAGGTLPQEGLR